MRSTSTCCLLAVTALAIAATRAPAAETFDTCSGFIATLPATVTTQGVWCLDKDLATGIGTGAAITVATNNVTIDCNGFKLGGLSAGEGTQAAGIQATDRANVSVRNCNIRGFQAGIRLLGAASGGHVVEDNRLDGNTAMAIQVEGDAFVIRRNLVTDTGGSSLAGNTAAIVANGQGDIEENRISGVSPGDLGEHSGVAAIAGSLSDSTITDNVMRGLLSRGSGLSVGFDNTLSTGPVSVQRNQMFGPGNPSAPSSGVYCQGADPAASLSGNYFAGFSGSLVNGCTDNGGNINEP